MKKIVILLIVSCIVNVSVARQKPAERPRVLISTDIGGTDPDDNQSMTHLMMYSDLFDLEGLVSSPSFGSGSAKEIFRMIDLYELDYPALKRHVNVMTPDALRALVKQGRTDELPACGYGEATEGSDWIVKCARKDDPRPLYVLVWGCLEDVAQALHDAPDIASKIRVYWIGGPNKKWGVNGYCYIIEHFPNLWMIENNTTYRSFIYSSKKQDKYHMGYFPTFIKNSGRLGRDFAAYYKGNPKLGDTPSLLYMMDGDPTNPEAQSWGGKFVKCNRTPRNVYRRATTAKDTAQICGIIEWQLKGPKRKDIAPDSACITLDIRKQKWRGYYKGNGLYVVRHSTYYTGTLDYTITSTVEGFKPIKGQITVENTWNRNNKTDYKVGSQWWTDSYAPEDYHDGCAGAHYQYIVREEIMEDWGMRWQWLRDAEKDRPRILISTDIGGTDPDDNQSMVHLMMYSDLFNLEGLVSSPSFGSGSKEEILRMISLYEKDYPKLKKKNPMLLSPDVLRTLAKQGRKGLMPFKGYAASTEGSEWIIQCARKQSEHPLWILVWGTLEDVAQALHDAPDIESKIRVYWIGGPNKKWGVNSYAYIAKNHPNLWIIENNATYRGFITDNDKMELIEEYKGMEADQNRYGTGYYDYAMKGAGHMGHDFAGYYKGVVKMGDTPSLLYMMQGNPDNPMEESWGGRFAPIKHSSRRVFHGQTTENDTIPVYSVVEWYFKGPKKKDIAEDSVCFVATIDKQQWAGYYVGNGQYVLRYSPKAPACLTYSISSPIKLLNGLKGSFVVDDVWPGKPDVNDYPLGNHWYSDLPDRSEYEGKWQGAKTQRKWRQAILEDWARRWNWLKE